MLRIHFTAEDLARIRLRPTLGPVAETVFALGMLGRTGSPAQVRWRNQLARHLRHDGALGRLLTSPTPHRFQAPGDLLCLVDRSGAAGDGALRAAGLTRRDAAAGVLEVWRLGVEPYWHRIVARLTAECDARGRISMAGGVDRLFDTLHSRIAWNAPVLEIPGPAQDVHLAGRGLVLVPSMFLPHRPAVLVGAEAETGLPALVFAVAPDAQPTADVWEETGDSAQALGALVGRTRAEALRVLTSACTTTQLAERLGISSAGASQHTSVLRQSGLITTMRNRNTVLHTVTPLGMALLGVPQQAQPAVPAATA
ncbi:winged helix-turn-helix domain-containing protein [Kitasatospora sp. NPDC048545]|uniref:ArsR/SmtB family transcription factor n=1 Tax=Kitasatospora sp. NPDC048545 TaxID=3157208 RepID=UPI0033E25996